MSYSKEEIIELLACKWSSIYPSKFEAIRDISNNAIYEDCRDWGVPVYAVLREIGDIKYKNRRV